jgi:UMF1 family MFS transporter
MYDWANSAFSTTVMAGFVPVLFKQYWSAGVDASVSSFRLGLTNSIASLVVALLAPALGAVADAGGSRRRFLLVFAAVGILATVGLALVGPGDWALAAGVYAVGILGFSASMIFYDALLVDVSTPSTADRVSALGFALGYLGGGVLFALNVLMAQKPAFFGLADATAAARVSFLTVAVWWTVFSIPLARHVRERSAAASAGGADGRRGSAASAGGADGTPVEHERVAPDGAPGARSGASTTGWAGDRTREDPHERAGATRRGWHQFVHTLRHLRRHRNALVFLLGYWLYIDGVHTIVRMAVDYGISLGFASTSLILALLVTQFVGFPASIAFGRIGERFGARTGIFVAIVVYAGICLWGYRLAHVWEFYALAAAIGLVQGGINSLSRSLYSRLVPAEQSAQFFGYYNTIGRFSAVLGPALMGWVSVATGNPRLSMLALLVLFALGAMFLARVRERPLSSAELTAGDGDRGISP